MADTIQSTIDVRWGDTLRSEQVIPATTPVGTTFYKKNVGDLIYLPDNGTPRGILISFTAKASQSPNYFFNRGVFEIYAGAGQTTQYIPFQFFPGGVDFPYFNQFSLPAEQLRINWSWEIITSGIPPVDERFTIEVSAICGPYLAYLDNEKRKGGW